MGLLQTRREGSGGRTRIDSARDRARLKLTLRAASAWACRSTRPKRSRRRTTARAIIKFLFLLKFGNKKCATALRCRGPWARWGRNLSHVAPGEVDISFDRAQPLTQQHGFLHAGMVATALDSACGYAGFSLMPEGAAVLTIEFKINLLGTRPGPALSHGRAGAQARDAPSPSARAAPLPSTRAWKSCVATMQCT